jgi:hypothetical protein
MLVEMTKSKDVDFILLTYLRRQNNKDYARWVLASIMEDLQCTL